MILKKFALQIDLPKVNQSVIDYTYDFYKKSRHICNYIERECFKQIKFKTDNFGKIVITLSETAKAPYVNSSKVLCISIPFIKNVYDSCNSQIKFREFIVDCINTGLKLIEGQFIVPVSEINLSISNLRKIDFNNSWIFKKKSDRNRKLDVELVCVLAIDKFELKLDVYHEKTAIYNQVILKTDADEIAFDYKFKDILIDQEKITITSKTNGILYELNLKLIGI